MKRIILASTSPRRKDIFSKLGIDFDIVPSSYEEDMSALPDPKELVKFLSFHKAAAVAHDLDDDAIVIGADTIVVLDDLPLGKPKNSEEAKAMLRSLSGRTHQVMTGVTLIDCNTKEPLYQEATIAHITLREITDTEIDAYIASGEPMDKAGAYAIQEKGAIFVENIDGDFFAVMGLPIFTLAKELEKHISIW